MLKSETKLAYCQRNARMNFSVVILESGERLAEDWDGLVRSPFCDQILSEDRHVVSRLRMILSIPGLHDARPPFAGDARRPRSYSTGTECPRDW